MLKSWQQWSPALHYDQTTENRTLAPPSQKCQSIVTVGPARPQTAPPLSSAPGCPMLLQRHRHPAIHLRQASSGWFYGADRMIESILWARVMAFSNLASFFNCDWFEIGFKVSRFSAQLRPALSVLFRPFPLSRSSLRSQQWPLPFNRRVFEAMEFFQTISGRAIRKNPASSSKRSMIPSLPGDAAMAIHFDAAQRILRDIRIQLYESER